MHIHSIITLKDPLARFVRERERVFRIRVTNSSSSVREAREEGRKYFVEWGFPPGKRPLGHILKLSPPSILQTFFLARLDSYPVEYSDFADSECCMYAHTRGWSRERKRDSHAGIRSFGRPTRDRQKSEEFRRSVASIMKRWTCLKLV